MRPFVRPTVVPEDALARLHGRARPLLYVLEERSTSDLLALELACMQGGLRRPGKRLKLRGLMAVAPLGEQPAAAFARLAEVREAFVRDHPGATVLSAGMSGDLEAAITCGATHVRVGSAVLGPRPAVQ